MEELSKYNVTQTFEEIVIDFGDICRFCLIETNSKISILDSVFTDDSMDIKADSIFNFVQKLTSIKVNDVESFPSRVCEKCLEVVKVCYKFSQVCQQSDTSLRNCYEKTLQQAKAKLNTNLNPKEPQSEHFSANDSVKLEEEELLKSNDHDGRRQKKPVWKSLSPKKSKNSINLQADGIKLKYQNMNSLSERLKEAQTKLAEDILRSNHMMLELPKGDDLVKVLKNQKSPYGCPECSSKFTSPEVLKFHYVATHGQTRKFKNIIKFQCKKCVRNFSEQQKLIIHYKDVHKILESQLNEEDINFRVKKIVWLGKKKFYCLHCVPYKLFRTHLELVKHLKEKHDLFSSKQSLNLYFCSHCENETSFPSKFSLQCHLRTVHKLQENEITWRDFKSNSPEHILSKDCSESDANEELDKNSTLKKLPVKNLNVFKSEEVNFKVVCKNCTPSLEFSSANDFVHHMFTNHSDTALENWDIECPTEMFKNASEWKCSDCSLSFNQRKSFVCHMKEKHNKTNIGAMKCPETNCFEYFFTNRQLIQHGITTHQKYFANFHSIYTKNFLQTSMEEDNRIKSFECDICQKKYLCKNSLKRHMLKIHLGKSEPEAVVCSYCGKKLSSKLNLKSHIEFVHEAVFVSCPICKKNINFKTLGKHYKTHQLVDSKNRFLCNLCGKILKSKRSFQDHQNLHKNIRDQLCDICGSGFTTKKFLLLHKKTHEGVVEKKIFSCDQCDKVFSGRHTLNRHLLTHSGQKNFICEICSKCFYTLQELNRHVRYHKKEYRFDCQLCDMRFLDKSRFRHHMMKHRNVRPHKCQFCDKMFIVRGKMNMHMAAKHNVEIQTIKPVWKDPQTYVPLDDLL